MSDEQYHKCTKTHDVGMISVDITRTKMDGLKGFAFHQRE